MQLLVQLKPSEQDELPRSNGRRRRSQQEVRAFQEQNARYVAACLDKLRHSLPPGTTVSPLQNLNVLVVSIPSSWMAESIRQRIREACEGVVAISDDVTVHAAT